MLRVGVLLLMLVSLHFSTSAEDFLLNNPTSQPFEDECLRIPMPVPEGAFHVRSDGLPIPFCVDEVEDRKLLYVRVTIPAGATQTITVEPGEAILPDASVKVTQQSGEIVLDNGLFALKIPSHAASAPPGPITAIRLNDSWIGNSRWQTQMPFKRFSARIVDAGKVFGKVRLRYEFEGMAGLNDDLPAYSEIDITLQPGQPFAIVEERHEMARGSAWTFEATAGFKAAQAILRPYGSGFGSGGRKKELEGSLQPGQLSYQPPELLLNLWPRWNQHYKDGWLCGVRTEEYAVAAITVLPGRWYWPHDNGIACLVRESGDSLTFQFPTRRGMRYWWLYAGERDRIDIIKTERPDPRRPDKTIVETRDGARQLTARHAFDSLDTIVNYIPVRTFPDAKPGYSGYWPLGNHINPTAGIRGQGRNALANADKLVNDLGQLFQAQVMASPNTYGSYWNFWSSENPNFFTDFHKITLGMLCNFRSHPEFPRLARMAEQIFHEDVYHSIALPSGAGQECPGYLQYAMHHYLELAKVCQKHLGFDPLQWPQLKAGASFLVRISQPMGDGKRGSHPGGDTHPPYLQKDPREFAKSFGVEEDVTKYVTEELQGFGVVFRNRCGTDRETYLAFKAGPSRGHYHGDQLSFHYLENATKRAPDHHVSYIKRAGQEHMHNRVAFAAQDFPFANMDGYERVIAFKTTPTIDVAVGQVESWRLRKVQELPPENWHEEYPQLPFDKPLIYRRTIVQVKGERDYFVIRDQHESDRELSAVYCLHVVGEKAKFDGPKIDFGTLKLFVARPASFNSSNFDYAHDVGAPEATSGVRLTVQGTQSEFITVLYPGNNPPSMEAISGGVKVGNDTIVFSGGIDQLATVRYVEVKTRESELVLMGNEIDLERNQGEIGLFVPDAGYPFGEIPNWLARQRMPIPDWAPDWAKALRGRKQ